MKKKLLKLFENETFIFIVYVLGIMIALYCMYQDSHKETKVEVITVDCEVEDVGEMLPTEPWLFDEVEKFIKDKEVISIDYEIDRDSEDHVFRKAVVTYTE